MIWKQFTHLGHFPPELKSRFNSFLTTEFDDSLSVEMQLRSIIKWCQENFNTVDTLIDFINELSNWLKQFEINFDSKLEDSVESVLSEWQQSGYINVVISEALDWELKDYKLTNDSRVDGLETNLTAQMEDLESNLNTQMDDYKLELNERLNRLTLVADPPNGVDDTEHINDLITTVHARGGGVVTIPNGEYWVKAHVGPYHTNYLRDLGGIELKSNVHLKMSKGTVLRAIPNGEQQYVILRVYNKENVTITGGQLWGERYQHTDTVGEWGYGIAITGGKNIIVEDVKVKECWGDGVNLQAHRQDEDKTGTAITFPTNVTLRNIISSDNLRQGMSIEAGYNVLVDTCVFEKTGGKLPMAGVDIEPWTTEHTADYITFRKCIFKDNLGGGLLVTRRGTSHVNVIDCVFLDNKFESILLEGPVKNIKITHNTIRGPRIRVRSGVDVIISENRFAGGSAVSIADARNVLFEKNIITPEPTTDSTQSVVSIGNFQYGETHNINIVIRDNIIEGYLHQNAQGIITNNLQIRGISIERLRSGLISGNLIRNFITGIAYFGGVEELTITDNTFSVIAERGIDNVENTIVTNNRFYGGNFNNSNSVIYNEYKDGNVIKDNVLYRDKGIYGEPFTGAFISVTESPGSHISGNEEL